MTINAQSLQNKITEFDDVANKEIKPHIISVTESWGNKNITDGIFALKGYTMYRNDRNETRGGGALLYINDIIDQRVCRPLNTNDFGSSVWCWIIEKGGKKTLVGSVYRSPTNTEENDRLILEKISKANEIAGDNRLLILGDFNVPKIDWANKSLAQGARRIEVLTLDFVTDCFLHQHVREHMRYRNAESSQWT